MHNAHTDMNTPQTCMQKYTHPHAHVAWANCPLLCSTLWTWRCCWAATRGKGWPRFDGQGSL